MGAPNSSNSQRLVEVARNCGCPQSMLIQRAADIDWSAFDLEVDYYANEAGPDPDHPLLHLAVAALLEPLLDAGDIGRVADVFERVSAAEMDSWRLASIHAEALAASLEPELAAAAWERARALATAQGL